MTPDRDSTQAVLPHRGGTILLLGILSLPAAVLWIPLGFAPWLMASLDLRAMDAGYVESTGRTATQIGRGLGILASMIVASMWIVFALSILERVV